VDVLCPNASEAEAITGTSITDMKTAQLAARELHNSGVRTVMITLGEQGAMVCHEQGRCEHIPAFSITAIDTTAAGDAFAAAVSVALAGGLDVLEAARFGCAAGALAASRPGAQQAMPRRVTVEELMVS
jgi:ribokinase